LPLGWICKFNALARALIVRDEDEQKVMFSSRNSHALVPFCCLSTERNTMYKFILAAALTALAVPAASPAMAQNNWGQQDNGRYNDRRDDNRRDNDRRDNGRRDNDRRGNNGRNDRGDWRTGSRYDYNRPDPRYGGYDASRYYRANGSYKERRLGRNDRVYRGNDGRYYCRRNDGTTGLIIGGVLGGLLGNTLANGRSTTLATVLGAGGGALLGKSVDRGNVRCR
jgi:Ni/Co efflux regulator RcnB